LNFDKPDVTDMYDPNGIKRPSDTVIENLTGSFEDSLLTGALGANTEFISTTRVWEPIIERLNEFAGEQDVGFFMRYFSDAGANKFSNPGIAYSEVFNPLTNDNYLRLSGEIYKYVSENQDTLPDDLKGINEELISSLLKQQFDDAQASEQSRSIHNPGPLRATARFAGGTGSSVGDPINLITAPFGGAVVNQGGKLLWKGVASNMLVNAGAAALTEGEVADWYEKMGAEYTFEDFVYNVSLNAALGGALPLAVPGVRMTWQKSKELADILIAKGFKVDAKTQALLDMIDDFEATNDSNPFRRNSALESLDADAAHEEALTAASAAIQDGNAEFIPPAPLLPLKEQPTAPKQKAPLPSGRTVMDVIKDDDAYVVRLNAADLEVDAATFQYKSEGDEFGVTDVLRDEKEWIPSWSGTLTVYEYANGKRVVADGHQRIGFAKRVMAQDPSKNIEVNAIIFREADGVSPEEMRVIAALKNIVEGSGDAVDAAKVLRVDPSALPVLPAKSELVQQARGIRPLSNDSFGMVINGIVPAKYAQYVGDLIKDQNLQDAAMRVLAKSKPENKFQAEAMVRQVRDMPTAEVTQTSLFGDELMTESYFFERSKILNQAYTELRKDKSAFETLVRNSERLEAEGNVLVNDANERKAATDAQTIALLQTLANRKGPLSDALNDAARTARDTGNYKSARDGFLTAIRRSIDSGDFEGVSTGDIGRSFNGKAEVARDQIAEPELDGFEEPSGIAAQQQEEQLEIDMFGADEVEPGSLQDLSRLLDQNPTREQIDNHPSVLSALDEIESRPDTVKIDGYDSDDWHNSRVYKINGEDVVSTDEAMLRFERDAEALAFKELNLDVEPVLANKELTIVLGPPAAGKSTIANELAIANRSAILDSDEIKKTLPEYEGGVGASAVHEESSNLAKELQALMIERGTNIVLPKVGHSASSIRDVISLYKNKGYKVRLVNMDVTPENAFQRMIRRFVSTGRIIPPEYLDKVGSNPSSTYRTLKQEGVADGYAEIDNNGGFNEPKTVREISGENPLLGSSFDVPPGGRTGPDAIRSAEREGAEDLIQTEALAGADMDFEVPFESVLGADDQIEVRTMTLRELREEMRKEQAAIARLEFCTI
jgi:predicted kinase